MRGTFLGDDNQQPVREMLGTGAAGTRWEESGPEGIFLRLPFTEFSVQWSLETHPSHGRFRSEKGTKISVGKEHPFAAQQGVHSVGSWDFQREGIFLALLQLLT